jgi:hypothetical protein
VRDVGREQPPRRSPRNTRATECRLVWERAKSRAFHLVSFFFKPWDMLPAAAHMRRAMHPPIFFWLNFYNSNWLRICVFLSLVPRFQCILITCGISFFPRHYKHVGDKKEIGQCWAVIKKQEHTRRISGLLPKAHICFCLSGSFSS